MKQTKAVNVTLKVVTTSHQQMADICGVNPSSVCGRVYIETERKTRDEEVEGERQRERHLCVDKVLRQVVADLDSEEEYLLSYNDVQSSGESETFGWSPW